MKVLSRALIGALLFSLLAVTPATAIDTSPLSVAEQKLINTAASRGTVRVLITTAGMPAQKAVVSTLNAMGADVRTVYWAFPTILANVDQRHLALLFADARVTGVQEDGLSAPSLASSIPQINADDVHALGYDGSGATVAVLDTGIDRDHPFYNGRLVAEACFSNAGGAGSGATLCPGGGTAETGAGSADADIAICEDGGNNICDHGTHVAGIAAGEAAGVAGAPANGVAPNVNIIAIQVFTRFNNASDCGSDGAPCVRTYDSDQILGLQQVQALDGMIPGSDIVAANMSLGGGMFTTNCDGDARKASVDALLTAGIATVISAGNTGWDDAVGAPGCISTAVTVGSVDDADDPVAANDNRGPLIDIFAPGRVIDSAVIDDTFGNKSGTSMAAPHVAGAFAVLRDIYPSADIPTMLGWLTANGVTIDYTTAGSPISTPRLDLLAAIQPDVAVNTATVTVNEGSPASNSGTFSDPNGDSVTISASVGTVTPGAGTWSWSLTPYDGPTNSQVVTITAEDATGVKNTATFQLNVDNVAPSVTGDPLQVTTIAEGETLSVGSTFSDPGSLDTYDAKVDWGHAELGFSVASVGLTVDGPPAQDQGSVSSSKTYGDNGTFTVKTTVRDDDDGVGTSTFDVNVTNVAPTSALDTSGSTIINGVETLLGEAGSPVNLAARGDDPGSDDLTFAWNFDDGTNATAVSLAGAAADLLPSPLVNARVNVANAQSHTFADACVYQPTLDVSDDDGGAAAQKSVAVLVQGNATRSESTGWWHNQYDHNGIGSVFSQATLLCYLEIARFGSSVFDGLNLSTLNDAHATFHKDDLLSTPQEKLEKTLLTAWLNFANGAFAYGEAVVDTNKDGVNDLSFVNAVTTAEAVRLNPLSSPKELEAQRKIIHEINRYAK